MADLIYNDLRSHVLTRNTTEGHSGEAWWCPVGALHSMRALGWEPVEDAPEESDVPVEEPPAPSFEPSDHTVDEVSEYLAGQAANNPAEVQRVLDAERAGKNRKSIAVPDGFTNPEE